MNKVILTGNLCKDIDLKYTASNFAVLQNTVAVRNDFKNKDGEYESQFINFVAYRQTAEFISKYASKGSKVLIEGRWNNRNYEKEDGTKVYITEVVVEKVELLSSPSKNDSVEERKEEERIDPFAEFGNEVVLTDDDLPF